MTRNEVRMAMTFIAGLFIALLVCIVLLAGSNNNGSDAALEVMRQEYRREIAEIDREYNQKINTLQEQINTTTFQLNKRIDILDEDTRRLDREVDDLRERIKARDS